MATPELHNGADGKVFVTPPGGVSHIEMDVTKWELNILSNNKDVSGSKSGRTRIPGVPDANGTLTMHLDTANLQCDTGTTKPSIRHGTIIAVELVEDGGTGGTDAFRGSMIIDTVKASSEFDGTIDYECTYSLADGSTLKYPGDA